VRARSDRGQFRRGRPLSPPFIGHPRPAPDQNGTTRPGRASSRAWGRHGHAPEKTVQGPAESTANASAKAPGLADTRALARPEISTRRRAGVARPRGGIGGGNRREPGPCHRETPPGSCARTAAKSVLIRQTRGFRRARQAASSPTSNRRAGPDAPARPRTSAP
jgi:hypothetical protein